MIQVDAATNHLVGRTYDGRGNDRGPGERTAGNEEYTYDVLNMLSREATSDTRYLYTADDERIAIIKNETVAPTYTWTVRGLDGKVLREFVKSPSGTWTVTTYVYRGSQLAASMKSGDTPGAMRHYHLDHLGTPRLVTDDDGIQKAYHHYYPFGNETSATKDTDQDFRMKFTGHERDVDTANLEQLDYMHARYYGARLGRFLSVDAGRSSQTLPQEWNRYSYTAQNPILYLDPDGFERTIYFLSGLSLAPADDDVLKIRPFIEKNSGFKLDIRSTRNRESVVGAFGALDSSDIAVLSSHAGVSRETFQPIFQVGRMRDNISASEIIGAVRSAGTPQAIILAGCNSAPAAAEMAKALNTTVFGTTGLTSSPANGLAGVVLAQVFARTGNADLAVKMANAIIQSTVACKGSDCAKWVYYRHEAPKDTK